MEQRKNNNGKLIVVLIFIILVLVGVVLYMTALKPAVQGYVVEKQIFAQNMVVDAILTQVQQQNYIQLIDGEGNTIDLITTDFCQQQFQLQE